MLPRRTLLSAAGASAVVLPPADATISLQDWRDRARSRVVPVLIRIPGELSGPAPVVLLSHGLGGSRQGLGYLGRALAEAGYVVVHLQHPGSDCAVWRGQADMRGAMMAAVSNPRAALARLRDVAFALQHVLRGGIEGVAADPQRVAIAGHSYGAWTASHMVGERLPLFVPGVRLPDQRLRAAVLLSPIPPIGISAERAFPAIAVPTLHVTGTRDAGFGVPDWRARTAGFAHARAPAALAVMEGAAHASFAGEEEIGGHWDDPTFQGRTARLTVAFLDAALGGARLSQSALVTAAGLRAGDTLETRGLADAA